MKVSRNFPVGGLPENMKSTITSRQSCNMKRNGKENASDDLDFGTVLSLGSKNKDCFFAKNKE